MINNVKDLQKEWANPYIQWYAAGMPTFTTVNLAPWKQITLNFKTMDDRKHFSDLMGYNLTERTGVVWYPSKESEKNNTNRIVEEVQSEKKDV